MSGTTNCMCFNIQGNPLHKYGGSNYSSVIVKRLGVMSLGPLQSTCAFPLQLHRCKKNINSKSIKSPMWLWPDISLHVLSFTFIPFNRPRFAQSTSSTRPYHFHPRWPCATVVSVANALQWGTWSSSITGGLERSRSRFSWNKLMMFVFDKPRMGHNV